MATVTKTVLKTYFEQGDIPTQGQYVDLIDSQFGLGETGTQIIQGTISASQAKIEYITLKKLHLPGIGIANENTPRTGSKVGSTFSVGQSFEVSGSINVTNGNIIITSSGEFQGESANITNITSSYISASGTITANEYGGNVILNGTNTNGTGSFGRVEVATRLEHKDDSNTCIKFASDNVTITANNVQGAKFGTTGGVSLGNSSYPTNITGSVVNIKHNITASNASFVEGRFSSRLFANKGVILENGMHAESATVWSHTGTVTTSNKRTFTIQFTGLPDFDGAVSLVSNEYMRIANTELTDKSIVVGSQGETNLSGEIIIMNIFQVTSGVFYVTPTVINNTIKSTGGSGYYKFTIL